MAPTKERTVGQATVLVHPDVDDLAQAAAEEAASAIAEAVAERQQASVMVATGNSQLAFVEHLAARTDIDWSATTVFHMDEYVGVGPNDGPGFQRWVRQRLVERVHPRAAHYLDGLAEPEAEAARYAGLLARHPLDLCCLGIGENGHLAFNDPPVADFDDPATVKVVELDEACRRQQVGEGHFPDLEAVPRRAITVTVPALLAARRVIACVPEARKATAVAEALTGPVTARCPASALRRCPQAIIHLDEASASQLPWG